MSRAHSPTFPSLHLRHNSFSNPSVALPTSQVILQPFRCVTYVTSSSLNLRGEPSMSRRHKLNKEGMQNFTELSTVIGSCSPSRVSLMRCSWSSRVLLFYFTCAPLIYPRGCLRSSNLEHPPSHPLPLHPGFMFKITRLTSILKRQNFMETRNFAIGILSYNFLRENIIVLRCLFKASQNYRILLLYSCLLKVTKTKIPFLLSSDIRSKGSIAIVKKLDFDFLWFFILHHSHSLKMCFRKKCVCVCPSPIAEPKPINRSRSNSISGVLL